MCTSFSVPVKSLVLKSGKTIWYHGIFEIIKLVLKSEQLTSNWVYGTSTNEEHWSAYPAWLEYQQELRKKVLVWYYFFCYLYFSLMTIYWTQQGEGAILEFTLVWQIFQLVCT